MYRIVVEVLLCAKDGSMGLSRQLLLPFVPFEGLELYGLTADPVQPETVGVVAWNVWENCFHIELLDRHGNECLSALIDSYGPAWQLHEPGSDCFQDN